MKKILLIITPLLLLLACGPRSSQSPFLNKNNIRSQHFSINPGRDTVLTGMRGGYFFFEKGSFEGTDPVDIEIKEVYNPIEILYAGLTTESGGRLLESGGMVYVGAKQGGRDAVLKKTAKISIPASYVNHNMQLFRGEVKTNDTIDWVDPQPLDTIHRPSPADSGKIIFRQQCASCHKVFIDGPGPALAGVTSRVNDMNVLKAFIRNPPIMIEENSYFNCLRLRYGALMTSHPLTDTQIDQVLAYIHEEELARPDLVKKIKTGFPAKSDTIRKDSTSSFQGCIPAPCGFDTIYVDTTDYTRNATLFNLAEEAPATDSLDSQYNDPAELENIMRTKGFTDVIQTKGRYNFAIKTLGWFNVDAYYDGLPGTTIVDLFVKTDYEKNNDLAIHVFFPSKKLLTVGTYHPEDSLFHFEKYKGQIPLFLNDEAVVFGVDSHGEKIFYGISTFTVTQNQTIALHIQETTKKELQKAFLEMKLDGVDLDVITKRRLVVPKPCGGTEPSVTK